MWREAARYEPRMDDDERERLLGRWREAVERARGWADALTADRRVTGRREEGRSQCRRPRPDRMAELKPQRYKETRPAEQFQPVHEWSRTHEPGWIYEAGPADHDPDRVFLYRDPRRSRPRTCPPTAR